MVASTQIVGVLSVLLVTVFLIVTAALFVMAVVNRLRLRRVLLTWRSGIVPGFPIWPTVYFTAVLLFLAYSIGADLSLNPYVVTGFLVGGTFWFAACVISQCVVVTDYAVLKYLSNTSGAVSWGQIVDYFTRAGRLGTKYAFFYVDRNGNRKRIDMMVPHYVHGLFQRIVSTKLDARFDYPFEQVYGRKALND